MQNFWGEIWVRWILKASLCSFQKNWGAVQHGLHLISTAPYCGSFIDLHTSNRKLCQTQAQAQALLVPSTTKMSIWTTCGAFQTRVYKLATTTSREWQALWTSRFQMSVAVSNMGVEKRQGWVSRIWNMPRWGRGRIKFRQGQVQCGSWILTFFLSLIHIHDQLRLSLAMELTEVQIEP